MRERERSGSRREKTQKKEDEGVLSDKDETKKKHKKKRSLSLKTSGGSSKAAGGSLGCQASLIMMPPAKVEESVKRKQSKIGLGGPQSQTMKLSSMHMRSSSNLSMSTASTLQQKDKDKDRESTIRSRMSAGSDSAHLVMGANGRPASASVSSTSGSSMRPPSSMSGISAFSFRSPRSSNGSVASVRWDEAGLQTVEEMQRRERERRRQSVESQSQSQSKAKSSTREREGKGSEGRRRATIADIFPEVQVRQQPASKPVQPIEPIEEVSVDSSLSQESPREDVTSTVKKARRRPMSEQMIGRPRPKGMSGGEDGKDSLQLGSQCTCNSFYCQVSSHCWMLLRMSSRRSLTVWISRPRQRTRLSSTQPQCRLIRGRCRSVSPVEETLSQAREKSNSASIPRRTLLFSRPSTPPPLRRDSNRWMLRSNATCLESRSYRGLVSIGKSHRPRRRTRPRGQTAHFAFLLRRGPSLRCQHPKSLPSLSSLSTPQSADVSPDSNLYPHRALQSTSALAVFHFRLPLARDPTLRRLASNHPPSLTTTSLRRRLRALLPSSVRARVTSPLFCRRCVTLVLCCPLKL